MNLYSWISDLIGYTGSSVSDEVIFSISGVVLILLFTVTVDMIFSLFVNFTRRRFR